MTQQGCMVVRYTRRGSFADVGYGDTAEECLASALAEGYRLATVGPRTRGRPRFFVHDGSAWREVDGEEFERRRGLEEPPMLWWAA